MVRVVRKACACFVRCGSAGAELLVFDHPAARTQLPKGTVEGTKTPRDAVTREWAEETGVRAVTVRAPLGEWTRLAGAGPDETGERERHVWEVFLLEPTSALPEDWVHQASGSIEEDGLLFSCRAAAITLHSLFGPIVALLQDAMPIERQD